MPKTTSSGILAMLYHWILIKIERFNKHFVNPYRPKDLLFRYKNHVNFLFTVKHAQEYLSQDILFGMFKKINLAM